MQVIEIKNAELMSALQERLAELGIAFGAIVSLIGAVDSFTLSTMPKRDATLNVVHEHRQPAEMSGSGEVVNGLPHIHATMAIEGGKAISGHLNAATVKTWFAHVYVLPMDR
ncbi:PCC domain-containing protein [Actinomadura scrupuli]|uniref:PCC domain-containing protein n=1 Tax=Actinomadura scrupuli TaxID=559629 RepID=UPI003D990CDB